MVADRRGRVRRLLPLLIVVVAVLWIAVIVTLITVDPASGRPLD